jgi:hypothetical protein
MSEFDSYLMLQRRLLADALKDVAEAGEQLLFSDYDRDLLEEVVNLLRTGRLEEIAVKLNMLAQSIHTNWLSPSESLTENLNTAAQPLAGEGREKLDHMISAIAAMASRKFADDPQEASEALRRFCNGARDLLQLRGQILDV